MVIYHIIHFTMQTTVQYKHADRQWDCRFNIQTDESLNKLLEGVRRDITGGRIRYVLVGGPEIGTKQHQSDYNIRHVHVAVIFHNRVTKSSILKNWNINEGNGYYLVPRNRDFPYSGWRKHHIKEYSKVNKDEIILLEEGELPPDGDTKFVQSSEEEKKKKTDEVIIQMRALIDDGKEEEAFTRFPRNYLIYGEKLKAMSTQKRDRLTSNGDPHIWLHGFAGTGKTALLNFVYPKYYKKNLYNRFFDCYNPAEHTHVMLEDLDHEACERLSMNFLKTICDEGGFAIDQKYKACGLARASILVTSNFTLDQIMIDGYGVDVNKAAMYRRFWHINISALLRLLQLKLIPKEDRAKLKKEGNLDPSKLFMTWDYLQECPMGEHLKEPEHYQQVIKDYYYSQSEICDDHDTSYKRVKV